MNTVELLHDHGEDLDKLAKAISDVELFCHVAELFKQLSDSTRIRIFWLLCHCEECVTNISLLVNMTSPAVSHHLKQLKACGLIVSRRKGKEVFYKISDTQEAQSLHLMIDKVLRLTCPFELPSHLNK